MNNKYFMIICISNHIKMFYVMFSFIAANTAYLYNEKQKVLINCYTNGVTLEYNKNINQMKVILFSNNNSDCEVLPHGIEAQLILRGGTTIYVSKLTNFSYHTTK